MTPFEILEVGDSRLLQPSIPVTDFNDSDLTDLVERMMLTMEKAGGVGIAAQQVGILEAVMIIASKPNERYPDAPMMEPLVMINPDIEASSLEQSYGWEGCLSVPGFRGWVRRSDTVDVRYQDLNGQWQQLHLDGFPARIFAHEYDHLRAMTFLERINHNRHLATEAVYYKILNGQIPWRPGTK